MSVLKVNSFQNTGGTTALTFGNTRMEPNRLVLPVVTNATLPPASSTEAGEIYFNDSDDKLYISKGDGSYQVKSSFSQPTGTYEYGWSSSSSNGTYSQGHPINIWFRRNIFQTVYDTSDLSSVEDGAIFRNLKHYVTNAISNSYSARGLNIRLFHTTASKGSDASPISGESKTTVYSIANGTDVSQWQSTGEQTFTFSTPFEWNGADNICIEYCTAQNQNRYRNDGQARVVNETGSRYRRTDASGSSCSDSPSASVSQRPSIKMDYF
jgi:hypothetical protein